MVLAARAAGPCEEHVKPATATETDAVAFGNLNRCQDANRTATPQSDDATSRMLTNGPLTQRRIEYSNEPSSRPLPGPYAVTSAAHGESMVSADRSMRGAMGQRGFSTLAAAQGVAGQQRRRDFRSAT
jgi:hypothetical protein